MVAAGNPGGAESCLISAQRRGFEADGQLVSELGEDAAARLAAAAEDDMDDGHAFAMSYDNVSGAHEDVSGPDNDVLGHDNDVSGHEGDEADDFEDAQDE